MSKNKNILLFLLIILGIACESGDSDKLSNESAIVEFEGLTNSESLQGDGFYHNGNFIFIDEQKTKQKSFTIQQIENKRQDVIFRAKKIPNELYLKRKGLKGKELELALSDVQGEQLFFFEFEETQNRDIMKKYFADKGMDKPVSYMSFDIAEDFIALNSRGDTLRAEYSLYERDYHVSPFERIIVGFNDIDESEELKLIYNDILFGKGEMSFSFAPTEVVNKNFKNPS